jgi:hypothetical protein
VAKFGDGAKNVKEFAWPNTKYSTFGVRNISKENKRFHQ